MPTCKILFFLLLALCTLCGKCDVLYQKVGGDVSMDCGPLPPKSDVEWRLNGIHIVTIRGRSGTKAMGNAYKDKVRVIDGTLKVPKLETGDSGDYTCVQTGKKYTLRVVSVFAKQAVLVQSSNAELHCDITGEPKAEVKWLNPSKVEINDKTQRIELKSVTSNEDGEWICQINDLKISLKLTVFAGLQTKAVEVAEGGNVVLPCSFPQSVSPRVEGGKWKADHLPAVSFPTLTNSKSKGLHWNGMNSSKVTFTSEQLSTHYDVTLLKAQPSDAGDFVCTVKLEGGAELTAKTNLTVVAKPSGGSEQEVTKVRGKKHAGGGPWNKEVYGLQLWIWIAVGASAVVLIGLVVVIVFVQRRNKRMKKRVKKLRSMRQPLTAKDYCQCNCQYNRAEAEVELRQQERPLPVPRKQRNPRTHPAGPNHTFDKSQEQDY